MIQLTDKLIAVLIPGDAYDVQILGDNILGMCSDLDKNPSGNFQIRTDKHLLVNVIGIISFPGEFDWEINEFEKGLYFEQLNSKGINIQNLNGNKILILEQI